MSGLGQALTLILVLLCSFAGSTWAQDSEEFVWQRYDVDLNLQQDGSIQVTETQEVRFLSGQRRNGGRSIPLDKIDEVNEVRVFEVGPDGDQELRVATAQENNELQIRWHYRPAGPGDTHIFKLQYTVSGVVRIYPDRQRIQWVAVPPERRFPVEESTVNMRLPSRVDAGDLKLDTHPAVLHGTASPTRDGAVFRVSDVPAAEGFGVLAQFPSGVIHAQPPSWQEEADREERLQNRRVLLRLADLVLSVGRFLLLLVLGLAALLAWWFIYRRRRRESSTLGQHSDRGG